MRNTFKGQCSAGLTTDQMRREKMQTDHLTHYGKINILYRNLICVQSGEDNTRYNILKISATIEVAFFSYTKM